MPVLSGIRAYLSGNDLQLTGSDTDLTIEVSIKVNGERDGVVVLPGRLAAEIVRALPPGAVVVEIEEDEARITSGRAEFAIRILPAEEYPRLPEPAGEPLTLRAGDLAAALKQVVPAASSDDARPILTGVLLPSAGGGLRLVATDSYRLAVRDLPGAAVLSEGQQVLVPSRALSELGRVLTGADDVELRLGERDASFQVGTIRLTTRLIEGEFPNYRGLIPPSYPNRLTVGRDPLLAAVRRWQL